MTEEIINLRSLIQSGQKLAKIDRLEQENAELKAENERLKLSEKDLSRICQGLKKDIETEKFYTLKYYKTLQEIKAIAETAINGGYATKSSDYSEGMEIIGHYVLQKITKAEEE